MVVLASSLFADTTETWDGGTLSNWVRYDPVNQYSPSMNNPGDCLKIDFAKQSTPFPEVSFIKADTNASGGAFTGNCLVEAVTNVSFRIFCEALPPGEIQLFFCGGTNSTLWHCMLDTPAVGEWVTYSVPMKKDTGEWTCGSVPSAKKFRQDSSDVRWVGIKLQRNGSVASHKFKIDDFAINGIERGIDTDRDGVSDWHEFMAGTDHRDGKSEFRCNLIRPDPAKGETGVALQWNSAEGITYTVWRSVGNLKDFRRQAVGIEATPPVNTYRDETANGRGPYFYKIEIEQ